MQQGFERPASTASSRNPGDLHPPAMQENPDDLHTSKQRVPFDF
ncbi:hypothetical protein SAMN05661012_05088 [Chitinophaga sancti]|uniref:Uncharacterized protein n=1 Tax=Chitinophaga sancti TaxID=1004 RepID=A0A1K1SAX0_9BACT|nr:hypothetical protein SAMN05661012_05088 [Chitinophaga sancti]